MTRNRKLLVQAIKGRRKVELRYDSTEGFGHPEKWRVFHPHALYPKEDGTLEVTGRQEVKNRREPSPRNFELPRILELRLLPDRFTPGPPVKADAAKYRHGIVCKIGD